MTTPFVCLVIVAALPYVLAGVGAFFRYRQLGTIDNNHPRLQAQQLEGTAARAYAAQQNAWEALALFGIAVLMAHLAGADGAASSTAAIVFVAVRLLHAVFYVANLAPLRSLAFVVGLGCCVRLFWLAYSAPS